MCRVSGSICVHRGVPVGLDWNLARCGLGSATALVPSDPSWSILVCELGPPCVLALFAWAVLTVSSGTDHSTLASGMARALDLGSCAFSGLYTY